MLMASASRKEQIREVINIYMEYNAEQISDKYILEDIVTYQDSEQDILEKVDAVKTQILVTIWVNLFIAIHLKTLRCRYISKSEKQLASMSIVRLGRLIHNPHLWNEEKARTLAKYLKELMEFCIPTYVPYLSHELTSPKFAADLGIPQEIWEKILIDSEKIDVDSRVHS